jgi:hypothetical protein
MDNSTGHSWTTGISAFTDAAEPDALQTSSVKIEVFLSGEMLTDNGDAIETDKAIRIRIIPFLIYINFEKYHP